MIPRSRLRRTGAAGCSLENALLLGSYSSSTTVPSNACVAITQYPSWWQWGSKLVRLQSGASGNYPVPFSYTDACTQSSGDATFTTTWQQHDIGHHEPGCPTLIQLMGDGSNIALQWY